MPSKGIRKLWNTVTGGNKKTAAETVDEHLKEQNKLTEDRVRELSMAQLLKETELMLSSSECKLSAKQIDDLGIRSVLKRARYELVEHPVMIDQDMTEIDECIKYIINEISRAAKQGYETAAHWANVALATATETLHIPIEGNDTEYAAELMKERCKYARNLKLLTQNALSYDQYTAELANNIERYNKKEEEISKLTEDVQKVLDSKDGPYLLHEVEINADDLSRLTDRRAMQLRSDLIMLHHLEDALIAFSIDVNAAAENQTMYAQQMDQCRNYIANIPKVTDPKLAAKNHEAAEAYTAELRRRLNNAEAGMKAIAANLSELMNLGSHTLFQTGSAIALDERAKLQMRVIREKESRLAAAKAAVRNKEQNQLLQQIEHQLTEQLNILAQEDATEINVTTVDNVNDITDQITAEIHATEDLLEEDDDDLLITADI